jgi:CheY-like chemotaxis protein
LDVELHVGALFFMNDHAVFLLVEDDENDIALIRRAFQKAKVLNPLIVAKGGKEAIAYLGGEGKYADRAAFPLPTLVLLDLKMPDVDGFEVLRWMRMQPALKELRVVVQTGSQSIADIHNACRMGANSFVMKPADFERFVEVSQALGGWWAWLQKAPEVGEPPGSTHPGGWQLSYRAGGPRVEG